MTETPTFQQLDLESVDIFTLTTCLETFSLDELAALAGAVELLQRLARSER